MKRSQKEKNKDTDISGDREQRNESGDNMNIDIESSKINNPFTKRKLIKTMYYKNEKF